MNEPVLTNHLSCPVLIEKDEHDTHFLGFARNLMAELLMTMEHDIKTKATPESTAISCRLVLARRSYELALHVVQSLGWNNNPESLVNSVSDVLSFEIEEEEKQSYEREED